MKNRTHRPQRDAFAVPSRDELIRVELTESLSRGGFSKAKRLRPSGSNRTLETWGEEFTVHDTLSRASGSSGHRFWILKRSDTQFHEIIAGASGEEIVFYNDSGETIPPFGCMAVTGIHEAEGTIYFKVKKPSSTFRRMYIPNGETEVPAGEFGAIPDRRHARWLINTGSVFHGRGYGPTPDQWYLTEAYPAVSEAVGMYDDVELVMWGTVHTIDIVIGKIASGYTLTPGITVTIDVWGGAESEAKIGSLTLEAKDWLMVSGGISSGSKVVVTWINGRAYVTEVSCRP